MDDDYYEKGFLGWQTSEQIQYGIIEGYKGSLDILLDFVISSNNIKILDTYLFPIMFLYRHFIEVNLKFTYFSFFNKIPKTTHNLKELFENIENDIFKREELKSYFSEKDCFEIKNMILEIYNKDEKGDAFRYGLDKKDNRYFVNSENISYLDIKINSDKIYLYFDYVNNFVYEKFIEFKN